MPFTLGEPDSGGQFDPNNFIQPWPNLSFSGQGVRFATLFEEMKQEENGSPMMSGGGDQSVSSMVCDRHFKISWDEHLQVAAQVEGFCVRDPLGGKLRRWLPEWHPKIPYLVAKKWGPIQPVTWLNKEAVATAYGIKYINRYEFGHMPVHYETVDYRIFGDEWIGQRDQFGTAGMHDYTFEPESPDTSPNSWFYTEFDRYLSASIKPATKTFSPTPGGFYWAAGSANAGRSFVGSPAIIIGICDIVWIWRGVPYDAIPSQKISASVGKVNKNWVRPIPGLFNTDGTPFAAKPHQLLLNYWDLRTRVDILGQWVADVILGVRYNPIKWTRFYDHLATTKNAAGAAQTGGQDSKWWFITQQTGGATITPGSMSDGTGALDEVDFRSFFVPR